MQTINDRCCGATRITTPTDGHGETLKFVGVPDSLSGAFLNDISGLDSKHEHPLKGAVYYTEDSDSKTFTVTIFQNDHEDLPKAFEGWLMSFLYMKYADEETMSKILEAEKSL